ncbi:helix-turn-helix domain-containing protein [Paenibacillus silvae]|uniref:helix-turn-helix domain-containing protein n=1 Tax=Paenibacillus silvae TaxID=1325358 RepID=UPI0020033AB5|nr:helix-turn-helix domain-containing protein [Paenibacillus silvae]
MRKISYLHKMIIFGLLLSTVPILLTGIAAIMYSSSQTELHRAEANEQLLEQIQSNVEHKLATVSYMLDQAVRSPITRRSLTDPALQQRKNPLQAVELQTEFQHMRSWEPMLDIMLVNQSQNWLIDHAGLYANTRFPLSLPMKDLITNTLTSGWQLAPSSIFSHENSSENTASRTSCIYHIALARTVPDVAHSSNVALIAGIPACYMQNPLGQSVASESSASGLIIINRDQRIIAHPNAAYIGQPLSALGLQDRNKGESIEALIPVTYSDAFAKREVRFADADYSLTYTPSTLKGWTYILISPENTLTKDYIQIGFHTLYISLAMLLLSLLLAWLGSRQMLAPIKRILAQLGDHMSVKGSGHTISLNQNVVSQPDELEQIRLGVTRLSDARSRLECTLNQHQGQIRTYYMLQWFQGRTCPNTMHETLREQGYVTQLSTWQHIAVIALQPELLNHERYTMEDRSLLLFALQNILEESIRPDQQLLPIVMEQNVVTVVGTNEEDKTVFSKQLLLRTEQLQLQIHEVLDLKVSIGLSQPHLFMDHIPQAYNEAMDALKHRMRLGAGIIVQYGQFDLVSTAWAMTYPEALEYSLLQSIQQADETAAAAQLTEMMQTVFSLECTPEEYQAALMRLLTRVLQVAQESGVRLSQISAGSRSLFQELHNLQYAAEIEQWFYREVILPVMDIFRERQYAQYQNISEKMIAMIQQDYDKDLTLEECAERLHYNANYLSSVFRKETGASFSEYLTRYRLNIAKRWLDESEWTVKEIAERLRYTNPQNFIRSFRKWEGMTPGRYRERKQHPERAVKG